MKLASLLLISLIFATVQVSAQFTPKDKRIAIIDPDSAACRAKSLTDANRKVEETSNELRREFEKDRIRRLKALREMGDLKGSYKDFLKAQKEYYSPISPRVHELSKRLASLADDRSRLRGKFLQLAVALAREQNVTLFPRRPVYYVYFDAAIDVTAGLCSAIDDFVRNGGKLAYRFEVPEAKYGYIVSGSFRYPDSKIERVARAWSERKSLDEKQAATPEENWKIALEMNRVKEKITAEQKAVDKGLLEFAKSTGLTWVVLNGSGRETNPWRDLTNEFVSYYNQRYP